MEHEFIGDIDQAVQRLKSDLHDHPVVGPVMRGTATRPVFEEFLKGSYHYVRRTKPRLEQAATAFYNMGKDRDLGDLCLAKAQEEDGHDQWLLEDLEALGVDSRAIKRSRPYPGHMAYDGLLRHFIETGWPHCVLVAAFLFEKLGAECAPYAAENLRSRSRIGALRRGEGLRFLREHGHSDQEHLVRLEARLRGAANREHGRRMVMLNAVFCHLYPGFFRTMRLQGL